MYAFMSSSTLAGPVSQPASQAVFSFDPNLAQPTHLIMNAYNNQNTGWEVPPEEWLSQEHERPMGPPPTSRRAVARLPEVVLTEADLAVDTNEECTCSCWWCFLGGW